MTDRFELRNKTEDKAFEKLLSESPPLSVRKHSGWVIHVTGKKGKVKKAFDYLPPLAKQRGLPCCTTCP